MREPMNLSRPSVEWSDDVRAAVSPGWTVIRVTTLKERTAMLVARYWRDLGCWLVSVPHHDVQSTDPALWVVLVAVAVPTRDACGVASVADRVMDMRRSLPDTVTVRFA